MDDFLSHPAKRAALIKKGLERAKDFSWEKTGAAVLAQYRTFEPPKKEVPPLKTGVIEEAAIVTSEPLETPTVQETEENPKTPA